MRDFIRIIQEGLVSEDIFNREERDWERTPTTGHKTILENPVFKQWFGKSKAVDSKGFPLVCYHGSFHSFTKFTHNAGPVRSYGFDNLGFWFDAHPATANYFAGHDGHSEKTGSVMPVFLKIERPLVMSSEYLWSGDRDDILAKRKAFLAQDKLRNSAKYDNGWYKLPDGSYYDEGDYQETERAYDAAVKNLETNRIDGFDRLMKLLPKRAKSSDEEVRAFKAEIIAEGHDGIHIEGTTADWGSRDHKATDWWLAFRPNQIKSIWSQAFTDSDHIGEGAE